jgi:23S rRNA (uracil1939-C5)-methyltransferase
MRFIAASGCKRVIYVSCNPEALAHDAAVLNRAGYEVISAVPIDQFPYSGNLESVVVFGK